MRLTPKRVMAAVAAGTGLLAYIWIAAVRAAPGIRRRKAARRPGQRG